jgi:FAD dependent oxidoreductase TIGR03364
LAKLIGDAELPQGARATNDHVDVAVVGAGIIGLAHALAAARRGLSVAIFERGLRANGASVRNFGTIWPIGQPAGRMHQLALRSRQLWLELLTSAGLSHRPTGSLHVMYRDDETDVAREFIERAPALGYECFWLNAAATVGRSRAVVTRGLRGAIWSPTELSVDPREVVSWLPTFLEKRYGVQLHFGCAVTEIDTPYVRAGGRRVHTDAVIVCCGDDLETLYPGSLQTAGITRCKLQMMRTAPQANWQLGPVLAGGLTLQHYPSFTVCTSLGALKRRIAQETPELNHSGIHILVSQTSDGAITLGDSHEYGLTVDVFDKPAIDDLILHHARQFLFLPDWTITQRWHGVYAKHPDTPYVSFSPAPQVKVVTALGGAGMTLSLGLAECTVEEMGL